MVLCVYMVCIYIYVCVCVYGINMTSMDAIDCNLFCLAEMKLFVSWTKGEKKRKHLWANVILPAVLCVHSLKQYHTINSVVPHSDAVSIKLCLSSSISVLCCIFSFLFSLFRFFFLLFFFFILFVWLLPYQCTNLLLIYCIHRFMWTFVDRCCGKFIIWRDQQHFLNAKPSNIMPRPLHTHTHWMYEREREREKKPLLFIVVVDDYGIGKNGPVFRHFIFV